MSGREVASVPLAELSPDPDQPRKHFTEESLLGMARTLKERQLHPVLAHRQEDKLVILDGERRWRAAKLAGLDHVDVVVVETPSAREAMRSALVANLQREDLSPMEKARGIQRLKEATGATAAEVAGTLGLSRGNVSRLLALLELPESVQEQVDQGELAASTAYQIARKGEGAEALAAETIENSLTREEVAKQGRSRGPQRARRKPAPRLVAELGGGRSVTLSGPSLDSVEVLISWLEELLGKARKARPRGMEPKTFAALLRDEAKASASATKTKGASE